MTKAAFMKIRLITAAAALWCCHVAWAEEPTDPDIALKPVHIIAKPATVADDDLRTQVGNMRKFTSIEFVKAD
jgi:hypothetical protein